MQVVVVGAGYAGLVTAAGLADLGHSVRCIDVSSDRIRALQRGEVPLFEPGLAPILERTTASGSLTFTDSYEDVEVGDGVVFLVVGSPSLPDGSVDTGHLFEAVAQIAPSLSAGATVVVKSTVPVGTARSVASAVETLRPDIDVDVVSNPEFLRQGAAVADFLHPDRIVIGADSDRARDVMRQIYQPLLTAGAPGVFTTSESAELIKYAANSFLALKLSFVNEMSDLAEASGAVMEDVVRGIGLDPRIGSSYLRPGPGFGGSCLPKDTKGLLHTTREFGVESRILEAVLDVNRERVGRLVDRIESVAGGSLDGRRVGMLGVTFKAETDDTRESPAIAVIRETMRRGASVCVFDPRGIEGAREDLGDEVHVASDEYEAAAGADVCVIATEWPRFASLSLDRLAKAMSTPVVVDLRRMWSPDVMAAAGIRYYAVGSPDPD
jgi:UDPglucose 6-dehydrogenase